MSSPARPPHDSFPPVGAENPPALRVPCAQELQERQEAQERLEALWQEVEESDSTRSLRSPSDASPAATSSARRHASSSFANRRVRSLWSPLSSPQHTRSARHTRQWSAAAVPFSFSFSSPLHPSALPADAQSSPQHPLTPTADGKAQAHGDGEERAEAERAAGHKPSKSAGSLPFLQLGQWSRSSPNLRSPISPPAAPTSPSDTAWSLPAFAKSVTLRSSPRATTSPRAAAAWVERAVSVTSAEAPGILESRTFDPIASPLAAAPPAPLSDARRSAEAEVAGGGRSSPLRGGGWRKPAAGGRRSEGGREPTVTAEMGEGAGERASAGEEDKGWASGSGRGNRWRTKAALPQLNVRRNSVDSPQPSPQPSPQQSAQQQQALKVLHQRRPPLSPSTSPHASPKPSPTASSTDPAAAASAKSLLRSPRSPCAAAAAAASPRSQVVVVRSFVEHRRRVAEAEQREAAELGEAAVAGRADPGNEGQEGRRGGVSWNGAVQSSDAAAAAGGAVGEVERGSEIQQGSGRVAERLAPGVSGTAGMQRGEERMDVGMTQAGVVDDPQCTAGGHMHGGGEGEQVRVQAAVGGGSPPASRAGGRGVGGHGERGREDEQQAWLTADDGTAGHRQAKEATQERRGEGYHGDDTGGAHAMSASYHSHSSPPSKPPQSPRPALSPKPRSHAPRSSVSLGSLGSPRGSAPPHSLDPAHRPAASPSQPLRSNPLVPPLSLSPPLAPCHSQHSPLNSPLGSTLSSPRGAVSSSNSARTRPTLPSPPSQLSPRGNHMPPPAVLSSPIGNCEQQQTARGSQGVAPLLSVGSSQHTPCSPRAPSSPAPSPGPRSQSRHVKSGSIDSMSAALSSPRSPLGSRAPDASALHAPGGPGSRALAPGQSSSRSPKHFSSCHAAIGPTNGGRAGVGQSGSGTSSGAIVGTANHGSGGGGQQAEGRDGGSGAVERSVSEQHHTHHMRPTATTLSPQSDVPEAIKRRHTYASTPTLAIPLPLPKPGPNGCPPPLSPTLSRAAGSSKGSRKGDGRQGGQRGTGVGKAEGAVDVVTAAAAAVAVPSEEQRVEGAADAKRRFRRELSLSGYLSSG
ncbi:unnamed protein product [Closterium sp. Naga37s-1]|nr:unnamed protein product [Closterium sp. Naga37s-1]